MTRQYIDRIKVERATELRRRAALKPRLSVPPHEPPARCTPVGAMPWEIEDLDGHEFDRPLPPDDWSLR